MHGIESDLCKCGVIESGETDAGTSRGCFTSNLKKQYPQVISPFNITNLHEALEVVPICGLPDNTVTLTGIE